jgi:membrane protein YdbS with pleckstrin-like domain
MRRVTAQPMLSRAQKPEVTMRLVWVVVFVWLLIGALAAGQRHYYTTGSADCAGAGTIAVTILFGPVNYFGANPKLTCH